MLRKFKKNEKGFTLVELVVVIAILAILSGLLVPRIMGNVQDAKNAKELTNARTIAGQITTHNALEKVKTTGTQTFVPNPLPTTGEVKLVTISGGTGNYDPSIFGNLPDTSVADIYVDSNGNARIDEK